MLDDSAFDRVTPHYKLKNLTHRLEFPFLHFARRELLDHLTHPSWAPQE